MDFVINLSMDTVNICKKRNRYLTYMFINVGDITIGGCANAVGIKIGNSYDKQNKPRFHPHDYKCHFFGPLPQPLYTAGSHNGKIGKDCCSIDTISFHYVPLKDMYEIHANKTFLRDLLT
jgi:hypothetical protein